MFVYVASSTLTNKASFDAKTSAYSFTPHTPNLAEKRDLPSADIMHRTNNFDASRFG